MGKFKFLSELPFPAIPSKVTLGNLNYRTEKTKSIFYEFIADKPTFLSTKFTHSRLMKRKLSR